MNIAIYGYGALGKGVESAATFAEDMDLIGVFSRRDPQSIQTVSGVPVYHVDELINFIGKIDVLVICGGSAFDLPKMTPMLAKSFHVVDSFDTHAAIPTHFAEVDQSARESRHLALISAGWDPGLFSLNRVYASAVLPNGKDYTFWGRGVSQGHSEAIRRLDGVADAKQYTIPVEAALETVRAGKEPNLKTRDKHIRECFVVPEEGADLVRIENEIKTMPNYFADYDTTVHFISQDELDREHAGIPHGGFVIRTGTTGWNTEHRHVIEYRLQLDSNPEFTSSVLVAYARAVYRMAQRGEIGCRTVFDIAPGDLSPMSAEELRKTML